MKLCKKLTKKARKAGKAVVNYGRNLWHRVSSEPGYADTAASLVVSIVALVCRNARVVRFTLETAQALARLARTLIGEPSSPQRWASSGPELLLESAWDSEVDWR